MAVEVLVRRGRAEVVPGWVDAYIRRLDELPRATGQITDASWPEALGDGRRIGDWTAYFTRQLAERPWRDVLVTWWPRLLPGIAAGATHGVIRTGHVVRTLLTSEDNAPTLDELGHALAFWAARSRSVPPAAAPAGQLDPQAALDAVPRVASQQGNLAARFGQLTQESGCPPRPGPGPARRPDGRGHAALPESRPRPPGPPGAHRHRPERRPARPAGLAGRPVGTEPDRGLDRQRGDLRRLRPSASRPARGRPARGRRARTPPGRPGRGRRNHRPRRSPWRRARHQVHRHRGRGLRAHRPGRSP